MNAALGLLLGLGAGTLSVLSLWLITGFTARAAQGLTVAPMVERPTGWDIEAQDPDVMTAGQWWRREQAEGVTAPSPTVPPSARNGSTPLIENETPRLQGEPSPEAGLRSATVRVLFAFFLKAPLLLLIALAAQRLGTVALHWCVGGVVSVYCVAVFWAAARTARR